MALCDYYLCDVCGNKAFYDADIRDEAYFEVDMKVVCTDCKDEYTVVVVKKEPNDEQD